MMEVIKMNKYEIFNIEIIIFTILIMSAMTLSLIIFQHLVYSMISITILVVIHVLGAHEIYQSIYN